MKTAVITIKTNAEFKKRVFNAAKEQGQSLTGYVLAAVLEKMNNDVEILHMKEKGDL